MSTSTFPSEKVCFTPSIHLLLPPLKISRRELLFPTTAKKRTVFVLLCISFRIVSPLTGSTTYLSKSLSVNLGAPYKSKRVRDDEIGNSLSYVGSSRDLRLLSLFTDPFPFPLPLFCQRRGSETISYFRVLHIFSK